MAIEVRPITATLAEVSGVDMGSVDAETLEQPGKPGSTTRCWCCATRRSRSRNTLRSVVGLVISRSTRSRLAGRGILIVKIRSTAEHQYAANNWHSDVTWRAEPSMGSILRGS